MDLGELVAGVPGLRWRVAPQPEEALPEVTHVTLDSRRVGPGSLFVALRGDRADGKAFLPAALQAGAVAVVADQDPGELEVPVLLAEDPRDAVARLTWRLYRQHLEDFRIFAVTGTKGKTTTTRMLAAMLNAGEVPCGSAGTLGWVDREGRGEPLANTTPEATRLGEIVADLATRGHRALTLEASSQAGVQARLRHLPLAGLAFLNLTPEHAELHPTMDDYRAAKARLFSEAAAVDPELLVVVPAESPDGEAMVEAAGPRARVLRFREISADQAHGSLPDDGRIPEDELWGRVVEAGLDFLEVELAWREQRQRARLGFGGLFNLQNLLAAATLALGAGIPLEAVVAGASRLGPVRGRFEVLSKDGVFAMVDYAHSSNALEMLLQSCRPLVPEGRVLLVFGCGGKKDPRKRPRMGASAASHADLCWITNDNPRGEDPEKIAREILAGIPAGARGRARIQLDRRVAIRDALRAAQPGDLVVVAGKGHETVQDLGDRVIDFDDLAEIRGFWAEE